MTAYDPTKHVTAQELRGQGIPIPRQIPDDAYIPQDGWALVTEKFDVIPEGTYKERIALRMTVDFKEPFRDDRHIYWVDPKGNILTEQIEQEDHGRHVRGGSGPGGAVAGPG